MKRPGSVDKTVPIAELVAPDVLAALGPAPSPARLRAVLPRGWVPAGEGYARRDLRLFFREGWILAVCLVVFGALGTLLVLGGLPRGRDGALRAAALIFVVTLGAGLAGPLITRALRTRAPRRR